MIIRRVCFGEPKPGESQFAQLLSKLDESASYCNRTGPRQHDRVTDLPFTITELGLGYQHPTTLQFVSGATTQRGEFSLHHMPLYYEGAVAAKLDPIHIECARLCQAIYAYPGDAPETWDQRQDTNGVSWGIKFAGPRAFVVFRGSVTFLDWLRDLISVNPLRQSEHDKLGVMWDGFVLGMPETWAAIKPLIAGADEVVFTGHSLGAARADVAAAYALVS